MRSSPCRRVLLLPLLSAASAAFIVRPGVDNGPNALLSVPPPPFTHDPTGMRSTLSLPRPLGMSSRPSSEVLDRYTLSLEDAVTNWTAVVSPETTMMEGGVYLSARDANDVFVDTIKASFSRSDENPGLGLELLEVAGGRDDGVGITVISGVAEGGNAFGSGIVVGDSVIKINVSSEEEERDGEVSSSVGIECLGYDATVEAISSLPPPSGRQRVTLTLKRLRRKPKVQLRLQFPPGQNLPDETLEIFAGENLRRAMLVRGVKLNDPLSKRFDSGGTGDCGAEGTCATCAVSIARGAELTSPMGETERQVLADNPRWRFACRTVVGYGMTEGEVIVKVNPRQWDE